MTMIVRAVDAGGFEAELTRLAGSGQAQFAATCGKCHNLRGPQLVGPTLGGNPTLADRAALATLLREGRGEMPAIGRGWTDAQLDTLLAYTRSAGGEQ
jgi:mono/diheme cytochrome c family protein